MRDTGRKKKNWIKLFFRIIGSVLLLLLYVKFWKSNANNEICRRPYRFLALTVIYFVLSVALLFEDIWMPAVRGRLNSRMKTLLRVLMWGGIPLFCFLTTELACNKRWNSFAWIYVGYNYLIYLFICFALVLILGSEYAAFTLMELTSLIYGTASHYVIEFKNTRLRPSELLAARTGLEVAGGYSYTLTNGLVKAILLCMLVYVAIRFSVGRGARTKTKTEKKGKRLAIRSGMAIGGVVLLFGAYHVIDFSEWTGVSIYDWRPGHTYSWAGSALCFLIDCQNLRVEEPEGYSAEKAEEILASYETETKEEQTVQPDVIVIMNESFSDLSTVGPFESEDYLSNLNSVTDYMMKGYAYVSVYAGHTCNSEFEFLTGSSMGFLGTVTPYQTVSFEGVASLASVFNDLGYKTVAMHPHTPNNWNRKRVYSQMGFDSFINKKNGFEDATMWKDNWVDDESDYRELRRQVEEAEEPLFLFNVTAQNHGAFETAKLEGKDLIEIEEKYSKYDDVIAYLTSMKYSDMALGELIQYFRDSEDPVILCFFGDHQPKLSKKFLKKIAAANTDAADSSELELLQNQYMVPYMIWSNYLEPEQTEMDLSLNYLGAWLLNYIGATTPYAEYLLDLQNTVQAVNANGYMENGSWISLEDADESLNNYEIVQYNRLFDQ